MEKSANSFSNGLEFRHQQLDTRSDCCLLYTKETLTRRVSSNRQPLVGVLILILGLFVLQPTNVSGMRVVVQRVKSASVAVEGKIVSSVGPGIMALVGLHEKDTEEDLQYCCKRLLGCKLWDNGNGGMWRHGVKTKGFEVLCVSQFTLYGTLTKKNQPDYKLAMKAVPAQALYNQFLDMLKTGYESEKIKDGVFGAMMDVELINDGPVTIVIESTPSGSVEEKAEKS